MVEATGRGPALWQPVLHDGDAGRRAARRLGRGLARPVRPRGGRRRAVRRRGRGRRSSGPTSLAQLDELNGRLARQVEALRLSDQVKSDFVSSVSHELRTPLASILGYLEILSTGEVGDLTEIQSEFLDIIDTNAHRLLTLINDLLTLSGLENGKLAMRFETIDLCELVRERRAGRSGPPCWSAVSEIDVRCPTRRSRSPPTPTGSGRWSPTSLPTPIKFTPEGGRISVRLQPSRTAMAELIVEDSGIGISEDDLGRMFERFFRAASATEQAIPGTGLGLAISKGIVDAHGGTPRGRERARPRIGVHGAASHDRAPRDAAQAA